MELHLQNVRMGFAHYDVSSWSLSVSNIRSAHNAMAVEKNKPSATVVGETLPIVVGEKRNAEESEVAVHLGAVAWEV